MAKRNQDRFWLGFLGFIGFLGFLAFAENTPPFLFYFTQILHQSQVRQ